MIIADARHAVGDALRAKLPDVTVLDQPSTITSGSYTGRLAMLSVPTVDYLTDGRTVCREPVPVNVILTAGVPDTDPAATWDDLDDLLVEVADACAAAGYLPAAPANLLTLDDDRTPAWSLTVEV